MSVRRAAVASVAAVIPDQPDGQAVASQFFRQPSRATAWSFVGLRTGVMSHAQSPARKRGPGGIQIVIVRLDPAAPKSNRLVLALRRESDLFSMEVLGQS